VPGGRPAGEPGPRLDRGCDLGNCAVGDAQENESRVVRGQKNTALGEPAAHSAPDATARTDDVDALDH
jgi:hypothetical protein